MCVSPGAERGSIDLIKRVNLGATLLVKHFQDGKSQVITQPPPREKRPKKQAGKPRTREDVETRVVKGVTGRMRGRMTRAMNCIDILFRPESEDYREQVALNWMKKWVSKGGDSFPLEDGRTFGDLDEDQQQEAFKKIVNYDQTFKPEKKSRGYLFTLTQRSSEYHVNKGISGNDREFRYCYELSMDIIRRKNAQEAGDKRGKRTRMYLWVAEKQPKNKYNSLHIHCYTPEPILRRLPGETDWSHQYRQRTFVNKTWNGVRARFCKKNGYITDKQYKRWVREIDQMEAYFKNLETKKVKKGNAPKTKFYEFPNLTRVNSAYKIGSYLSKYLKKGEGEIEGNSVFMSPAVQIFMEAKREYHPIGSNSIDDANEALFQIQEMAQSQGKWCKLMEFEGTKIKVLVGLNSSDVRLYLDSLEVIHRDQVAPDIPAFSCTHKEPTYADWN